MSLLSALASFGSSAGDSYFGGISGNIGAFDYGINPLARFGYDKLWSDQRANSIKNAQAAYELQLQYLPKFVKGQRDALEQAGYNPILAVNSAAGSPMSSSLPSTDGLLHGSGGSNLLDNAAKAASIDQIDAQTEYIKRRSLGEGWVVRTLSRSEARGLGSRILNVLGLNLNESKSDTFLVAYNPIDDKWRYLGSSDSLGQTEPSSAVDVTPIDWKTDKSPRYKFDPKDWELKPEYRK